MSKILEIDSCYECPRCYYAYLDGKFQCTENYVFLETWDEGKIPSWCPLEDKEDD